MDDSVVITGAGVICSLGQSAPEILKALLSGRHGIQPIGGFEIRGFDCQYAAQVTGLDPFDMGVRPRDARIMDKHSYMLLKSSRDAFITARLDHAPVARENIGFFAGMGMVDYTIEDLMPAIAKSMNERGDLDYDVFYSEAYREIHPLWPLSMLNNISFCQVAVLLDIRGENAVFSPHADSGAQAIVEGIRSVVGQRSDVVLAGGVSEKVSPLSLARGHIFGILNSTGKDGEVLCHPFASERKGTVLGEGCGVIAMEMRSSAYKRGIPCTTKITGYGFACDPGEDNTGASSTAIASGMRRALERAALVPSDIDLIIANGDGTYHADRNEIEAINHVFSDCIGNVLVFSSKGSLGHLFAAAPAVDIILGMFMIDQGVIPATLHAVPPDDAVMFNIVNKRTVKSNLQRIMINCQSYEGQCASLILEDVRTRSNSAISLL